MTRYTTFIKRAPVFLVLLPIFFVLHGYNTHYGSVPVMGSIVLVLTYLLVSCIIAANAWLYFRDVHKAALMATFLMAYYFFYGHIKNVLSLQYRFIIPFSILLLLAVFIWINRRKRPLNKLTSYINILLLALIVYDLASLTIKASSKKSLPGSAMSKWLAPCDTCSKPDIFLIITDGYTSGKALKTQFNFDNRSFENELRQRGFHISPNSRSNYNFTLYSIPSLLNMEYIVPAQPVKIRQTYNAVRENIVTNYLIQSGYRFYNYSIFDVKDQAAQDYSYFIPTGVKLITSQTFLDRVTKDFEPDFLSGRFGKRLQKKYAYKHLDFNDNIISLTNNIVTVKTNTPKFVYTHLMMPHYPYYYDSTGNLSPINKLNSGYTGYLVYANKKILQLIDHILSSSQKPPVILLLGDHGFREAKLKMDALQSFLNLNAVYLPGKNYSGFYDSISCVNQFRVLLNTCFRQQLPMLKDSSVVVDVLDQ